MALGNIGSALAAISATIIAILTLIRGPAALRDWQKRQRDQAAAELTSGQPTAYAVLRVTGSGNTDLALSLRQLIQAEGYISRPPTTGEREALETGLDAMGITRAAYGRTRP